jgi:hypothetical protein
MAYITFQPNDHFNTKLYTGNGSTQNITGVGHQVDWTWIKYRTDTEGHGLFDVLRGALYRIQSNSNGVSSSQSGTVTAFGSDGFSLGSNAEVNANNGSFVSWNWKANGAGSANTDGAINSTVSANTTSGFSIVSYTGTLSGNGNTTVGHGLGVAPKMIITKSKSNGENWGVYHKDLTANYILQLNTTSAQINTTSEGTVTAPTSSVFTVNYRGEYGNSGQNYIAYCFAEKKGFSKFGSYTGNSNADGAFIYTGFRPGWIMIKRYDSGTEDWNMWDSKRIGYNISGNDKLFANLNNAELTTEDAIDILSNGFKLRSTNGGFNNSSGSYIYMAFAEEPLVSSNGVPATAR